MRFAVPAALAALAMLIAGCSANDEPADPTGTTAPPAGQPRATSTTAGPSATGTSATSTSGATGSAQTISVTVAGGQVTPPPASIQVKLGDTITIEVTSDVADQLHVIGYEKVQPLAAGTPGRLELAASVAGEFQVGLDQAQLLLFTLQVG